MKRNAEGKWVLPLKKPIAAHGDQVSELLLDEPDSKLVMELGYPYLVIESGGDGAVQLQPKVAARYIVRLAKVPLTTVEKLPIPALQELHGWLMGFFGEGASEEATTSEA